MQAIVFTPSTPSPMNLNALPAMPAGGFGSLPFSGFTLPMAQDLPYTGMEQGGTVEMARRRRRRRR